MGGTVAFPALTVALAAALAATHLFAARLRLRAVPRSEWLSGAGGASVAYVFVHVLPELSERRESLEGAFAGALEHHVYLVALAGFTAFYGLERFAARSGEDARGDDAETEPPAGVFWLHVGSFVAYNALVGYLLVHREERGLASLGFFAGAMALHFVVNDHGLRDHHRAAYDRTGRWLLAGGVLAGTAVGFAVAVEEALVSALFAFLAGGIVLNVVKEELPEERESDFRAFATGAAGYAALLLLA